MGKVLGALIVAVAVGAGVVWLLGFLFVGTAEILVWLIGVLIGILVFYAIYKMLSNKIEHAVEEHKESKQRVKDKAAVQDDLRQMETDRPSESD